MDYEGVDCMFLYVKNSGAVELCGRVFASTPVPRSFLSSSLTTVRGLSLRGARCGAVRPGLYAALHLVRDPEIHEFAFVFGRANQCSRPIARAAEHTFPGVLPHRFDLNFACMCSILQNLSVQQRLGA